ncbi:MAG: hypothetical protein HOW73_32045 [Polyangiaceae bacterium]|nr:hypothetical protein [Polyangiaceae bacterium]
MSNQNPWGPPPGHAPQWGAYPPPPAQGGYPMQPHQHHAPYYQPQPGPYGYGPSPMQPQINVIQQSNVMVVKAPFNHGIHIALDIFTCGAWIPIPLICWAVH